MFFWVTEKVLTVMCCSGVTSSSSPASPSQSGYIFERDPSKVKSMQIKDVRLVRGMDSITHSFIHTSVHFQGASRVWQEPEAKKRIRVPILVKPAVLRQEVRENSGIIT